MLFHTWTFLAFMLVVLPVFFALRKTRLWVPWLMLTSYVFYGWWNPYYLILIAYSTALDYVLVALMDQCPRDQARIDFLARIRRPQFGNRVLRNAFIGASSGVIALLALAALGP